MAITSVQEELEKFQKLNTDQKKELCLTILDGVREHGGVFLELHTLVSSGQATDREYDGIYQSAMEILSESEQKTAQVAIDRLEQIRTELAATRSREQQEKETDSNQAQAHLSILL